MGLMTETPWEAALSVNSMSHSNVDYHRENLKQLKKMQQMAKMKKEAEANKPMKAFGLPADLTEANKKKFDHVQSKVQEWVVSTNTNGGGSGRESKNFLKGHARTGPFLENGDNDSAIQIRRLSGLKANMASKDKLQPSDYGTMSQSCQSVPPLNLDEEYYDADDLNQEMSLRGIGIGVARFSDITIDERKDRIRNMVNEIYNSVPLSEGNHTRRSLNQNLKRFASVDNDIDSVMTAASTMRPSRTSHPASRLTRHPSHASAISKAAMMRKYASSPKLNNKVDQNQHISVQNLGPLTSATSMMNLKAKKNSLEEHVNRHMPLKKNSSAPMTSVRRRPSKDSTNPPPASQPTPAPSVMTTATSLQGDQEINFNDEINDHNDHDDDVDNAGEDQDPDLQSVVRGSDIDYIRANIHCASSIGHIRRKEVEAAKVKEEERKKSKSETMKPGKKYKSGSVPRYLTDRKAEWQAEAERVEREKPDPDCPPGHRKLSEGDRREALGGMKVKYQSLVSQFNNFPVRADTYRMKQLKTEIEKEMSALEEKIRVYERSKVFVKLDD